MRPFAFVLLSFLMFPGTAWAVQRHSGEGLVAHEIAHLALALALAQFALQARRSWAAGGRLLAWGAVLFGLWSLWAFTSHLLPGYPVWARDHLILVPAFFLLWRGIRARAREPRP